MNEQVNDQEILLVTEKGSNNLNAVSGNNEDGTPKTIKPTKRKRTGFPEN